MKKKLSLKQKAVCAILVMVFILAVTSAVISYRVYSFTMDAHYEMLTTNVAKTAAAVLDVEKVKHYTEMVNEIYLTNPLPELAKGEEEAYFAQYEALQDEEYQQLLQELGDIKKSSDVLSLYIISVDPASKSCVYIADGDESETACAAGTWDIIYEQNYDVLENPQHGFPAYITDTDEFGWLCSAGSPIMTEDGAVVAFAMVDTSMDSVVQDRHDYLIRLCVILAIVTFVLIIIFIRVVNKAVVTPLNALAAAAGSYVSDREAADTGERKSLLQSVEIHTGDEVEKLSDALKQMEQDINSYIKNLTAVTAEKERIGAELDVAARIQADMLPCIFPAFPDRHEFDIYATMTPAKEVGGDFYDFFLVDDDHLALVMADVSGKGVPAALFMMISKTLLKSAAQSGLSPKAVLEKVNNQLCENNEAEMFVTVWLGILEISTGKMMCANAGHEYPAIKRRDGSFELFKDKHGLVLAGMEGARYREYELQLAPGDSVFVYTDGVAEATNLHNELYGTDRMIAALNQQRDVKCEELLLMVHADVDKFAGEAPQFDDITMLCLRISDMESDRMKKKNISPKIENLGEATAFFEGLMEDGGVPMKVMTQINVAVDEIFSNIAHYSGATTAVLGCEINEKRVIVRFSDNGRPYDPTEVPDPDTTLSAEERQIGGLGIFMVKKMMDQVTYEYSDGFNVLTLEKSW